MKNERALNQSNIMKLCELFKEKVDGKHAFSKLPCLLKINHKRWESNYLII